MRAAAILLGCLVHCGAADPPPLKLFVRPTAAALKRAHDARTNAPPPATNRLKLTNIVEEFIVETSQPGEDSFERSRRRFESMNLAPPLRKGAPRDSASKGAARVLRNLPLPSGGLLSKNPNARRNPLEVDGW